MRISVILVAVTIFLCTSVRAEKKEFPWGMFLPVLTSQHECSISNLGLCKDPESCETIGAYWWSKECHKSMSSSQALMAKLAGDIHFTYNVSFRQACLS